MTLYELTGEYLELLNMLEDPDIDEEVLADTLESVGYEIEDKADGYAAVISEIESNAEKISAEIKRLTERKKQLETRTKQMKERIMFAMNTIGKKKIATALHTFSVCKNGGKLPLVIDDNLSLENILPEHIKVVTEIDKNAIRKYLESGGECSYAHFGERGESLRIK